MITEKDIGKEVILNGEMDGMEFSQEKAKILSVNSDVKYGAIGVEVLSRTSNRFHTCDGLCDNDRGYFVDEDMITFVSTAYDSLQSVLDDAVAQSSQGKGLERHANNNNFEDQVICVVGRLLKDHPFGAHAYQVIKKTIEAGRLYKIKGPEAAYQEVLGAINYAAAMSILIKEDKDDIKQKGE